MPGILIVDTHVIGSLIACLTDLKAIGVRAKRLAALQQVYHAAIPKELARRSNVSDERSGTLIVKAETSAVAAKLRQLVPRIVVDIVKSDPEVTAIRVEVQVSEDRPAAPRARPELSPEALETFARLRDTLPESPLRQALARLVEHGAPSHRQDDALQDHEHQDDQR
jgi:hypothetical protein